MIRTSEITWEDLRYVHSGCHAVGYTADDLFFKIGHIEPDEVQRQQYLAERQLALPIYGYQRNVDLPPWLFREIIEEFAETCHQVPQRINDLLIMPLAVKVMDHSGTIQGPDKSMTIFRIQYYLKEISGKGWDRGNPLMVWNNHYVGIDFGT